MEELIKIESKNGIKTVNAKELYEFLGYDKSQWSRWASKNIDNDEFFVHGTDYQGFDTMSSGNLTKDYALTLDMAKELSMLARNEKGKEARRYFIYMEKMAKSSGIILPDFTNPALAARAWADEVEKKQIAENKVSNLQIELDREKAWYSVKRIKSLGLLPDMTANNIWRPLKKWCVLNDVQIRDIFDANYGNVKTYHADAWRAVYGIDLYYGG